MLPGGCADSQAASGLPEEGISSGLLWLPGKGVSGGFMTAARKRKPGNVEVGRLPATSDVTQTQRPGEGDKVLCGIGCSLRSRIPGFWPWLFFRTKLTHCRWCLLGQSRGQ